MTTLENERFLRISLIVFEVGAFVVKHVLYKISAASGQSLETSLNAKRPRLLNFITRTEAIKLFPSNANVDPETWDLALLSRVLICVFSSSLCQTGKKELETLRYVRHEICHVSSPSLDNDTYIDFLDKLTDSVKKLCKCCNLNPGIAHESDELIEKYSKEQLDSESTLRRMSYPRNREIFQDISSKIDIITDGVAGIRADISKSNAEVLAEISAFKKELIEKLKGHATGENQFLSVLGIKIKIEDASSEDKEFVEGTFLEIINQAKRCYGNNHDDIEEVKNAIRSLVADINSIKGATVDRAQKSSILVHVRCTSLEGILALLQYTESPSFRDSLQNISQAIQEKTMRSCTLTGNVTMESCEEIQKLLSSRKQHNNMVLRNKIKRGTPPVVTLSVRVTSANALLQLWSMFEEGGANITLNRISNAFTQMTGRQITVSAEVNLDQFRTAMNVVVELMSERGNHSGLVVPKKSIVGNFQPINKTSVWIFEEKGFNRTITDVHASENLKQPWRKETVDVKLTNTDVIPKVSTASRISILPVSESTLIVANDRSTDLSPVTPETYDTVLDLPNPVPQTVSSDTQMIQGPKEEEIDASDFHRCIITSRKDKNNLRLYRLEEILTQTIMERKDFDYDQELDQEINISASSSDIVVAETARLLNIFIETLNMRLENKASDMASKLDKAVNGLLALICSVRGAHIYEVAHKCVLLKIRCSSCRSMRELLKTFQTAEFESAVKRLSDAVKDKCKNVTGLTMSVSKESMKCVEDHLKENVINFECEKLFCERHPNESVKLYCSDHCIFCCQKCAPENHRCCEGLRQISTLKEGDSDATFDITGNIAEHSIRLKKDKQTCDIYGCCILPNGELLVVDNCNKRLKKINCAFKLVSHCTMPDKPWDVCNVHSNEVAVALYDCVQFVNYEGKLKKTRLVKFDHDSNGLTFNGKNFFVLDDWNVYTYNSDFKDKKILYSCEAGKVWFNHIVANGENNLLYISDRYGKVEIITVDGNHLCTLKPNEFQNVWGICQGKHGKVLVTDADVCCIYSIDYHGDYSIIEPVTTKDLNLTKPMCISYDSNTSKVIIGHYQKDTLSVLEI